MKPQTLLQKAHSLVTEGGRSTPCYENMTESQREEFTVAVMRDLGEYAYEQITNADNIEKIAAAVIEALEETDARDRSVLERVIGQLVIEGVIKMCSNPIDKVLNTARSELAVTRQFYQNPNPMDRAIYNSPNL